MLTSLYIDNFAIVEHLDLDFASGMTAFTGETGAGKSIMIDALLLALGERTDTTIIRANAKKCEIIATFWIADATEPLLWLNNHDIAVEDNYIILKRVIFIEGRSKCYINGQPFILQKLKELSAMLVDIHGQHEHQSLLQPQIHRQHLDQFANHDELLIKVANKYKLCQQIKHKITDTQQQLIQNNHMQLLQYQIEELSALNLSSDEVSTLHDEHQLLHNAQDYLNSMQHINQLLNSETENNICQQLVYIINLLQKLPVNLQINNLIELLSSAHIQCSEAINEINNFVDQISLDPQRLQTIEMRMQEIHQIARKYHIDAKNILAHLEKLQNEWQTLRETTDNLLLFEQQYQQAVENYQQEALILRRSRQNAAPKLSQEITKIINQLAMPYAKISVSLQNIDKMQINGIDAVEYLVQTNLGSDFDTLQKIASGGELSRISLAIQLVTAQKNSTPTIIFDEVDVGIGGSTAARVGKLLKELGCRLQVFCVTHQPQVAAHAHHHIIVKKYNENQQTYLSVATLSITERIEEISRMLSGLKITTQTRLHAKDLLTQGQNE